MKLLLPSQYPDIIARDWQWSALLRVGPRCREKHVTQVAVDPLAATEAKISRGTTKSRSNAHCDMGYSGSLIAFEHETRDPPKPRR